MTRKGMHTRAKSIGSSARQSTNAEMVSIFDKEGHAHEVVVVVWLEACDL